MVVRQRRDSAHNVNGSLESLWTLVSVRFNSLERQKKIAGASRQCTFKSIVR